MLLFKNYTIQQGDTLTNIAQQELGSISQWQNLVSINSLRYPYISDNILDQYGAIKAEFPLYYNADIGESSLYFNSLLVTNGLLSLSTLDKDVPILLQKHENDGDFIFDEVKIKSVSIDTSNTSLYKIELDFPNLSFPQQSLIETGRLSTINDTSTSAVSGIRKYYMRYCYVGTDGLETIASPYNDTYDPLLLTYSIQTYNLQNAQYFTYTTPSVFPSGVQAIRLYVGLTSADLYLQATITIPGYVFSEKSTPLNFSTAAKLSLSDNTTVSRTGIKNYYSSQTIARVYEKPGTLTTYVLKSGDILKIPSNDTSSSSLIGTMANSSDSEKFISSLGKDISLDDKGQISFLGYNADLSTVEGLDNLKQALSNRLITEVGQLSLQPDYGNSVISYIGSKYSLNIVQKVSLEIINCLMRDPRVLSIATIEVSYDSATSALIASNIAVQISYNGSLLDLNPIKIPI